MQICTKLYRGRGGGCYLWNHNTATILKFIYTDTFTLPEVTSEPSSDGEESENDAEGLRI